MTVLIQPQLFAVAPCCTMQELVVEILRLATRNPMILERVNADLDRAALAAKRERAADAQWEKERELGPISTAKGFGETGGLVELADASKGGRPRMPAMVVLAGALIRGKLGSLTASDVRDRLKDSATFSAFLWQYGLSHADPTALARHVNNLSAETMELIHQAQLAQFREEDLDDFAVFSADSTSVRANAQWPNDSSLTYKLLRRALSTLRTFVEKKQWCRLRFHLTQGWLDELEKTAKAIDLQTGKTDAAKARKKLYAELVAVSRKLAVRLGHQWDRVQAEVMSHDLKPSQARIRQAAVDDLERCLVDALDVIDFAEARTQGESKVERDAHEKITGIVEQDAEIIKKGGRQDQFGFKIQAAFSGNGVVTALIVEKGNVSDSRSMLPLLDAAILRTGVTPSVGTVDDGYSSKHNFTRAVNSRGLAVMSISGAKGRHAIGDQIYDSEPYKDARRIRGKLEFPFFVLKHAHEMERMKRTGLTAVRREITEKVLAYNFARLIQLRKQRAAAELAAA